MKKEQWKIYCDMDGVLADFDGHFENHYGVLPHLVEQKKEMWDKVKAIVNYWLNIPWMRGGKTLWDYVSKHHYVVILSSPGDSDTERAIREKHEWLDREIGFCNRIFRLSERKHDLAGPNCVLIDDWGKNVQRWRDAGGIAIHHQNAAQTIRELRELGIEY